MRQNRVAILGGSGFIGRYIVKRLAERGDVVAVGGRNAAESRFLRLKGEVGQVALINVSIGDERLLRAFVADNDAVVNLVGILREGGSQRFEAIHHIGPARLARIAREAGVERFIQMSAIGADPRSMSAYARTKAAGEAAARDAFPTATILRPSVVFGPEDQFFNRFAAVATISPVLPLIGGGETLFQPVYVGDVAEAVVRVIDDSATAGRTYELGGPKVYSLRALFELLLEQIRRKRVLVNCAVRSRRDTGAPLVADARRAADPGSGRNAEIRQHRVAERAGVRGARHQSDRGRGDLADLSRPLPPRRLVRPRTRRISGCRSSAVDKLARFGS